MSTSWIVLAYRVPNEPSRHRVALWRELRRAGALSLQQATWALPTTASAVLAATHNPEALRYSSRVILFRDGKIEAEGRPEEISARLTVD